MSEPAIIFNPQQEEALTRLDGAKGFFVLKGYAGTGKTTVITYWMRKIREQRIRGKVPTICLTAPTNKATRVLKEKAQQINLPADVSTIHSLLGLKMKWVKDEQVLIPDPRGENRFGDYDYVIIDECGMVGLDPLLKEIQKAQDRAGNTVIYMGDPCQLPPVNEKDSETFLPEDQMELTQVMRQSGDNPIVDLSIYLRGEILGPRPRYPSKILEFVDNKHIFLKPLRDHQEEILEEFVQAELEGRDVRHVAWTNKVVDAWNNVIRDKVYGADRNEWNEGESIVTTAPVMNPHEEGIIFTTDTLLEIIDTPREELVNEVPVWILLVSAGREAVEIAVVTNQGGKEFNRRKNELLEKAKGDKREWQKFYRFMESFAYVKPAFSMTVHRSQGSTFDDVYVSYGNILQNPRKKEALQCLYVAITRPRSRLILV